MLFSAKNLFALAKLFAASTHNGACVCGLATMDFVGPLEPGEFQKLP
jgi:hypothetical protein